MVLGYLWMLRIGDIRAGTKVTGQLAARLRREVIALLHADPQRCDVCSLTPMGAAFLEQAAKGLRPGTPTELSRWDVVRCAACRRVTAVVDLLEGTSFGEDVAHDRLSREPPADLDAPLTLRPVIRSKRRRANRWRTIVAAGIVTTARGGEPRRPHPYGSDGADRVEPRRGDPDGEA